MTWRLVVVADALLIGLSGQSPAADTYLKEELRLPLPAAGSHGLEALLVRSNEPERYPFAVLSHGSPRSPNDRPNMTAWSMLPQAIELARRGWAAVVVMRRGYGGSGGAWAEGYGPCANPNYTEAGSAAAADLKAAISFLGSRPDIDPAHVIGIGVSAGGFATVALTADPPPGLVSAISFAGGRGSLRDGEVCREDRLIEAFRNFGKRSRIPMLWVYADNDHFFGPKPAQKLKEAFTGGGAAVEFVSAPAFGSDGHRLFSGAGISEWSGAVDSFLQHHGLAMRTTFLPPPPLPALTAPAALSANGRRAFETYLMSPPHKAFALAPDGHFGWQSSVRTTEAAKNRALQFCQQGANNCDVMFVDDAPVSKDSPRDN
jgi:dienelactone hydrolase